MKNQSAEIRFAYLYGLAMFLLVTLVFAVLCVLTAL